MEAVREYGFINAKVRAMRSRFLTEASFRQLAATRDSRELASALAQTRYRDAMNGVDPASVEAVESAIERFETGELLVILKYAKSGSADLVRLLIERYDVERLKACLRLVHGGSAPVEPPAGKPLVMSFSEQAVAAAGSFREAAALVPDADYRKALESSAAEVEERRTLFPAELALDRTLFGRIWKAGQSMNSRDRGIVRRLLGIEIDLKNLDWLSRFRNYYKLSASESLDLLLPNGSKLDAKALHRMAAEERIGDAFGRVSAGTGVPAPEAGTGPAAIESMERFLSHVLLAGARRAFIGNPLSIGSILGYFYCLRAETRNVRTLFTARRLGLDPHQAEAHLVL
ncbi:V-type ATPase subunit [bacterium]|nr:V-type ATPase subunit [bacterium]